MAAFIRRRAGKVDRPSQLKAKATERSNEPSARARMWPLEPSTHQPDSVARSAMSGGIYCEDAELEEVDDCDGIAYRMSLGRKLKLAIYPANIYGLKREKQAEKVLNPKTGKLEATGKLIEVENMRLLEKSPKTLLRRGNPFAQPKDAKRITAHTKMVRWQNEKPADLSDIDANVTGANAELDSLMLDTLAIVK